MGHPGAAFVDPQSKLVMVNTAVHKLPIDLDPLRESGALWAELVRQFGGQHRGKPDRDSDAL